MAKSNSSIWVSLGLNTDKFKKGVKGAKGSMSSLKSGLSSLSPISLGVAGAIAGIGLAVVGAVKTFKDFEKAGSDLKAVLGDNALPKDLENLAIQAKALGAATAFTATEVRGLQKEFAKLGFDPKQIENMTEATLNLAAAAGVELAEAASQAGITIRAFGLVSKDAAHVTDVMAKSFSSSALDMEKFSETMKNAAPIARATGVSLEIAAAAAGKLADAGISGSKAGTDLRRVFSELVKDGKPFAESLNDIAKEMENATSPAARLAIAERLVGERAKGALLILVDQKDALGELAKELKNADGAAQAMADTMLDNLAGDITKAGSALEGFILGLEDGTGAFSKLLRGVVQTATGILNAATSTDTLSKSLERQQGSLIELLAKSNDVNTSTTERLKIVGLLNKEYPELLKNLGIEKVSLDNLDTSLKRLNGNFGKRITVQKELEDLASNKRGLDFIELATQNQINDAIIKGTRILAEKGKADMLAGKSQKEQIKILQEEIGFFEDWTMSAKQASDASNILSQSTKSYSDSVKESSKIISELIKTKEDLNSFTTEELRNLSKSGLLIDSNINKQARLLIIERESANTKSELSIATDEFSNSTAELTKEQEKAAMAARKLELNLESLKDVKLGVLFGDARRAVGELAKELEPKKPIEMKLMVNPFLVVEGGDSGTAITGAMVDLGIQAGEALSNSLVAAAAGALTGLGEAIGTGEIANIGEQMTGAFAGLLETFGQQMIQLGLAQAALKLALSLGPLGAGVAIGAGVALIAAASAIKSNMSEGATGFAQGGIVTGSVFANVGEGRGTTKSNPEIIAPLDKLKNMIGNTGGGMPQRLEFEIRGETLVAILNRMDKNNKFS